jgi:hypothetical protein
VTVRPADEDVEAVRAQHALTTTWTVHRMANAHEEVEQLANDVLSLSDRLSAAVEGHAAAEQRAADAEKVVRRLSEAAAAVLYQHRGTHLPGGIAERTLDELSDALAETAALAAARAGEATEEHPCPKGDGCALNKGAVHCNHCHRNWPPDETWDAPAGEATEGKETA